MTHQASDFRPSGLYAGWPVAGAAFVLAIFSWGISFYGPPVFLATLHSRYGWSIALLSSAVTLHFLSGALIVARFGGLQARFGLQFLVRTGGLLAAIGLICWSQADRPWQVFLAAPVSGAGWALTNSAALNAIVSPWFRRRRPMALGIAFNGASFGGIVFSPLWVLLIAAQGFGEAALLLGGSFAITAWLLAGRFFAGTPASPDLAAEWADGPGTGRRGTQACQPTPLILPRTDRRYITLAAAAALGLFAQVGLISLFYALFEPRFGARDSALVITFMTALAILGRFILGVAMTHMAGGRIFATANTGLQTLGCIVLLCAGNTNLAILLGCALFGLGLGNTTSLPPLVVQNEFQTADTPRVVAQVTALAQIAYAFAPGIFGWLHELGGAAVFAAAAGLQGLALIFLCCGLPRRTSPAPALPGAAKIPCPR